MLNPDINPTEELRKLAMSDEEMFSVFVALGSIAVRVHFLFNPLSDFEEYAEMSGEDNKEAVFMELLTINSAIGEKLNEITERAIIIKEQEQEATQAELNRDFFGIMENGYGEDPEPPTE
jgi:hypothetical protein